MYLTIQNRDINHNYKPNHEIKDFIIELRDYARIYNKYLQLEDLKDDLTRDYMSTILLEYCTIKRNKNILKINFIMFGDNRSEIKAFYQAFIKTCLEDDIYHKTWYDYEDMVLILDLTYLDQTSAITKIITDFKTNILNF